MQNQFGNSSRSACADFLFSLFSFYRSWAFRLADKKQSDRPVVRCDSFNRPVLPSGTIQLAAAAGNHSQAVADAGQTLPTLTMTNTPGGGAIVQYAQGQDGQFFVPGWCRRSFLSIHSGPSFSMFALWAPPLARCSTSNHDKCL